MKVVKLYKYMWQEDGPSEAGTDLNLLALYPDNVIYKAGNFYTNTRIS